MEHTCCCGQKCTYPAQAGPAAPLCDCCRVRRVAQSRRDSLLFSEGCKEVWQWPRISPRSWLFSVDSGCCSPSAWWLSAPWQSWCPPCVPEEYLRYPTFPQLSLLRCSKVQTTSSHLLQIKKPFQGNVLLPTLLFWLSIGYSFSSLLCSLYSSAFWAVPVCCAGSCAGSTSPAMIVIS